MAGIPSPSAAFRLWKRTLVKVSLDLTSQQFHRALAEVVSPSFYTRLQYFLLSFQVGSRDGENRTRDLSIIGRVL